MSAGRISVEAASFWTAVLGAAWAMISEFVPLLPKAVGGSLLTTAGAIVAAEAWRAKRAEARVRRMQPGSRSEN
ncbi:hypothetical protein GCM10027605_41950 [Micromonospora zhanjiangensis]